MILHVLLLSLVTSCLAGCSHTLALVSKTDASINSLGSATVSISGGFSPSIVRWSDPGEQTGAVLSNAYEGTYFASATIEGCTSELQVEIGWTGASVFIGWDNRVAPHPNAQRLTWLVIHGDHFHAKAAVTTTGQGQSVLPEEGELLLSPMSPGGLGQLKSQDSGLLSIRPISVLQSFTTLWQSNSRYTQSLEAAGVDVHLILVGKSPELTVRSKSGTIIFAALAQPGAEYHMDEFSADLEVFAPANTAPGRYTLNVTLQDENSSGAQPSGVLTYVFTVEATVSTTTSTTSAAPTTTSTTTSTTTAAPTTTSTTTSTTAAITTTSTTTSTTAAITTTSATTSTTAASTITSTSESATTFPPPSTTQSIRIVHVIPSVLVDIYVNDLLALSSVGYGTVSEPLNLSPGRYDVAVRPAGAASNTQPILLASVQVTPLLSADVVAHLNRAGSPSLGVFVNIGSGLGRSDCIAEGQGRLIARHAAPVDSVTLSVGGTPIISNISNGQQGAAVVPSGTHRVSIAGGAPLFVPVNDRKLRVVYVTPVGTITYETCACQVCAIRLFASHVTPASAETRSLIELSVSGGVRPYTYLWSWNNETGSELRNVPGRDFSPYVALVTDAAGCVANISVVAPFVGPESFVAVDTRPLVFSGVYQNLTNPNFESLTWLLGHGDHYHPKAAKAYTGPRNATVAGRNGSVLPESGRIPIVMGSGVYANTLRSAPTSFLSIRNMESLRANQEILFLVSLYASQAGQFVPPPSNASIFLRLTNRSSDNVRIGSTSSRNIGLEVLGSEIPLPDMSVDLVIWLSGSAPQNTTNYTATFQLVNKNAPASLGETGNVTMLLTLTSCETFAASITRVVHASINDKARVEVTATGGTPPYSYLWSTNHTTSYIVDVPSVGTPYTVVVTDARGCSVTLSQVIDFTGPESFVAIDSREVIPTGVFAGLPNPNFGNLAWAIGHGDHYHGKATLVYAGNATNFTITRNAGVLPETGSIAMIAGNGVYGGRLRTAASSYLHLRSVHELARNQRVLYTSSSRRFSGGFGLGTTEPVLVREETIGTGSEGDSILSVQVNDAGDLLWAGSTQREGRIFRQGPINIANLVQDYPAIDTRLPRLAAGSDVAVWVATTATVPSLGYAVDRVYLHRPTWDSIPRVIAQVRFGTDFFALTDPKVNDLGEVALLQHRYSNGSRTLHYHSGTGSMADTSPVVSDWASIGSPHINNVGQIAFIGRRLATDQLDLWIYNVRSRALTSRSFASAAVVSGSLRDFTDSGNALIFQGNSSSGSFILVNTTGFRTILSAGQEGLASIEGGWLNNHNRVLFINRVQAANSTFSGTSQLWLYNIFDRSMTQVSRNADGHAVRSAGLSNNMRVVYTVVTRPDQNSTRTSLFMWSNNERHVHLVLVNRSSALRVGSPSALSIGLDQIGDRILLSSLSVDLVLWTDSSTLPGNYTATFRIEDALSRARNSNPLPSSGDISFLVTVSPSTTAPQFVDLGVIKDDCQERVQPGGLYVYSFIVRNLGTQDAVNVLLRDNFPSSYEIVSFSNACTNVGSNITCAFSTIQALSSVVANVTYRVRPNVPSGTYVSNCVQISSSSTETSLSNNEDCDTNIVVNCSSYNSICVSNADCCSPLLCLRHTSSCPGNTTTTTFRCATRGGFALF